MIDIRAAARALGGDVIGRDAVAAPGPGHSPRDRSLTVKFAARAPGGFLVYSHCDDDWRDCRDHVRARLGLPPWQPGDGQDRHVPPSQGKEFDRSATDAEGERRERSADDLIRINRAREIWDGGVCPRATLAELYLRSRAIRLAEDVDDTVLRFHEACPWREENTGGTIFVPALLAAFRSIDDDKITAVQRVALTPEGRKLGRRMLGVVHRAAVKLDPVGDTLHVGEGVETCLAARILGHAPTWALGSVGMIAQFPLVDGVARLRILGENDAASASASKLCGNRWQAAGRKVQIVTPDPGCGDLNDELVAKTLPP
jgi:hypothetical protein